jgi:preprotein translocase subunit SecD
VEVTSREDDVADQPVVLEEHDDDGNVIFTYELGPAQATGEIVSTASATLSQNGEWAVHLEVTGDGIDDFNAVASECFNHSETCPTGQLAIVLDSEVVSAPTIETASFTRDQIQISGSFDQSEAKDLANVLKFGALPVPFEIQQTQEVSATLGSDSLKAALIAGAVGLLLVFVYMIAYYRLLGLVAMGALLISGALLWSIVCWLGEVRGLSLTLAGITGIIVSIGIAVDSNVVFYENLKESVSRGRSVRAVNEAFSGAFSTIVKADVGSLIGALVLYLVAVGSVRGFALFLLISTLLDLVASYFFMRPLVVYMCRRSSLAEHPRRMGLPEPREVAS